MAALSSSLHGMYDSQRASNPKTSKVEKMEVDSNTHSSSEVMQSAVEKEQKLDQFEDVIVGLNAVTRAIEQMKVRLVVVFKDIQPSKVVAHIPMMCTVQSIPLCSLPVSPQTATCLFQNSHLKSVIAIAFTSNPNRDELVNFIASVSPKIPDNWLSNFGSLKPKPLSSTDIPLTQPASIKQKKLKGFGKKQSTVSYLPIHIKQFKHTAPIKPKASKSSSKKS